MLGRWCALLWSVLLTIGIVCGLLGLGQAMLWFSIRAANGAELSCRDQSVLDTAKRVIADGKLSDQIRHSQWGAVVGVPNAGNGVCGAMQCWGMLAGHPYCFGWRMYGGQVYVQAREY